MHIFPSSNNRRCFINIPMNIVKTMTNNVDNRTMFSVSHDSHINCYSIVYRPTMLKQIVLSLALYLSLLIPNPFWPRPTAYCNVYNFKTKVSINNACYINVFSWLVLFVGRYTDFNSLSSVLNSFFLI